MPGNWMSISTSAACRSRATRPPASPCPPRSSGSPSPAACPAGASGSGGCARRSGSAHSPRRTGIVKVNVEPTPTWLWTQIRPLCSSMNFRDRASPSPVPSIFLAAVPTCRNSSKIVLIDRNGKVSHVVIGLGGLSGVAEKKVVVPWSELKFAPVSEGKTRARRTRSPWTRRRSKGHRVMSGRLGRMWRRPQAPHRPYDEGYGSRR